MSIRIIRPASGYYAKPYCCFGHPVPGALKSACRLGISFTVSWGEERTYLFSLLLLLIQSSNIYPTLFVSVILMRVWMRALFTRLKQKIDSVSRNCFFFRPRIAPANICARRAVFAKRNSFVATHGVLCACLSLLSFSRSLSLSRFPLVLRASTFSHLAINRHSLSFTKIRQRAFTNPVIPSFTKYPDFVRRGTARN